MTEGVRSVLLFGIPETKDAEGSEGWSENGSVQKAVRLLKRELPELLVMTDVCLCEYTDHGHCGVIHGERILNDPTCRCSPASPSVMRKRAPTSSRRPT
jgi:porphobilinogen synthase